MAKELTEVADILEARIEAINALCEPSELRPVVEAQLRSVLGDAISALRESDAPRAAQGDWAVTMRLADDADVEAVEELIGMGHGAWDMVDPHKLLDCVRLHFAKTDAATPPSGSVPEKIAGMTVVPDETVPPGMAQIRDANGRLCAEIDLIYGDYTVYVSAWQGRTK